MKKKSLYCLFLSLVLIGPLAAARESALIYRDDLADIFARHSVKGTFVLSDPEAGEMTISNLEEAKQRKIPASTFKIPNTLIGLETGTVTVDSAAEWDGREREVPAWNRSHDLRSAFRNSVVWYYQGMVQRIGPEKIQEYLDRFDYGSRQMGGRLTEFWLDGSLQISALEQVEFLKKVYFNEFGLKPENIEALKEMMLLEETPGYKLYGKTGVAGRTMPAVGWLVGYVEKGERVYIYAMNLESPKVDKAFYSVRLKITKEILAELGVLDAPPE